MRPVAVVRCFVESNAIGTRRRSYTTWLFISVELEAANQIARLIVEVGKMLGCRLLQGN